MTEQEQYEAWLSGESIFEGTRLDNGELIAGLLHFSGRDLDTYIDDIMIDRRKPVYGIYWDDDDDPCTEVNKILEEQTQYA
jgi:hypothetical protein